MDRRTLLKTLSGAALAMTMGKLPLDAKETEPSPNLVISINDYNKLADLFDKLEMLKYEFCVKFCYKQYNSESYLEWREWDLELLEQKGLRKILIEKGFKVPDRIYRIREA